ncbi:MAG: lipid-A-disaccharide synthase [Gammaproteobacteria bacterium HGW-Gammaproteobacteria-8]|nr:MAG: lipid-A-disaccharide synthase [Gammaproteobacteria bacterium HGW-Gammaproteobacteria-8]
MSPTLAIGAGELSSDQLAASIVAELRQRLPASALVGINGPAMEAQGVERLASIDQLGVMGLFEVLAHLPRLVRLRRALVREILDRGSAMFIGVDAPDFNLGLARRLRREGLAAVQVVAPSVWAWRRYRIPKIARSLDLLLTLFPFEPELFHGTGLDARCIGHPLADEMPLAPDRAAARRALGLSAGGPVIALLPGSRAGEIARHALLLRELTRSLPKDCLPLLLLATEADRARFIEAAGADPVALGMQVIVGRTRQGLTAADVALTASGTVTLECLLARTPMVVFYRLPESTWRLAKSLALVKSRYISLPNVLAGAELVPERLQHAATAEQLLADVRAWLDDPARLARYREQAESLHRGLALGAAGRAAEAIIGLLDRRR